MCPSPSPAAAPTVKLAMSNVNVAEPPSVVAETARLTWLGSKHSKDSPLLDELPLVTVAPSASVTTKLF